jgi:hypothetical protein
MGSHLNREKKLGVVGAPVIPVIAGKPKIELQSRPTCTKSEILSPE